MDGAGEKGNIENSWQKQKGKKHLLDHLPPLFQDTLFKPALFPAIVQESFPGALHFHFSSDKVFLYCDHSWKWGRRPNSQQSPKHFLCLFFLSRNPYQPSLVPVNVVVNRQQFKWYTFLVYLIFLSQCLFFLSRNPYQPSTYSYRLWLLMSSLMGNSYRDSHFSYHIYFPLFIFCIFNSFLLINAC